MIKWDSAYGFTPIGPGFVMVRIDDETETKPVVRFPVVGWTQLPFEPYPVVYCAGLQVIADSGGWALVRE